MIKTKLVPFHPLLFAAYPVMALFAANIEQIRFTAILRSLLIAILATSSFWFLLNRVLHDWKRSAILVSLLAVLFFSYGHIYHYFEEHAFFGFFLGRHRLLAPVWIFLAALGTWAVLYKTKDLRFVTQTANFISCTLVLMPIAMMLVYIVRVNISAPGQVQMISQNGQIKLHSSPNMPDIYYIVLDAYTRQDVLKEKFGLDNTAFIEELEKLGFYVASCSQSNYGFTNFSLASTLHMDYMEKISERYLGGKIDLIWLPELLRKNEVRQNLEQLGYKVVAFQNDYFNLLWDDANIVYRLNPSELTPGRRLPAINGFEAMFIRQSALLLLTDSLAMYVNNLVPVENLPNNEHREIVLYMFNKLKEVPLAVESPKFVYAHFVAPHFPIVFGPEGEQVALAENADLATYIAGYRGEVLYLNKRILETVHEILAVSAIPPVIIIQGDHGDDKSEEDNRMKILNAYYLPGVDQRKLYPTISPVNSFRLVFNEYFGGNYPLLPDKSYYSLLADPLNYKEIPNRCPTGE